MLNLMCTTKDSSERQQVTLGSIPDINAPGHSDQLKGFEGFLRKGNNRQASIVVQRI